MNVAEIAAIIRSRLPRLDADLEGLLAPALATITERWPTAAVTVDYADHVADCLARQRDPATALAKLHCADLFLSWWAGTGNNDAIAAFEAVYGAEIAQIATRFRPRASDELQQLLRVKLFVGPDAKIRGYAGVGPLLAWLRVVAVRSFLDVARSERSRGYATELDENELLGLPGGTLSSDGAVGPALGSALKHAFANAVARLAPRQRTFLRHAYVDRLTLSQIADTYSIHRATVARTLATARAQLIEQTREGIVARLGAAPQDLLNTLSRLDRHLELSLSRILKTQSPAADGAR